MSSKLEAFKDIEKIGEGTYGKVYRCISKQRVLQGVLRTSKNDFFGHFSEFTIF